MCEVYKKSNLTDKLDIYVKGYDIGVVLADGKKGTANAKANGMFDLKTGIEKAIADAKRTKIKLTAVEKSILKTMEKCGAKYVIYERNTIKGYRNKNSEWAIYFDLDELKIAVKHLKTIEDYTLIKNLLTA